MREFCCLCPSSFCKRRKGRLNPLESESQQVSDGSAGTRKSRTDLEQYPGSSLEQVSSLQLRTWQCQVLSVPCLSVNTRCAGRAAQHRTDLFLVLAGLCKRPKSQERISGTSAFCSPPFPLSLSSTWLCLPGNN